MKTTLRCALSGVACSFAIFASLAAAGPLNPPAGAVAPTAKPLAEVEPRTAINATNTPGDATSLFKITQAGSYYLTGNITGVVGKNGIVIAASGVTLDLNGFDLAGVPGMGNFDGVTATGALITSLTVVNGSVRNWGGGGVNFASVAATGCRIEGVVASGNGGNGINSGHASTVTRCSAYANSANGFNAGNGSVLSGCSAHSNTGNGFVGGLGAAFSNCAAFSNAASGFFTTAGNTLTGCSSYGNSLSGFNVANAGTVVDCSARFNAIDGIVASSSCLIRGNTCANNGNNGDGAGIHIVGADCRVEGNNCTGADRGIDVDTSGNFIARNTCSGNSVNWDVVASNTILVVTATSAGAVLGNAGGTAPGSTDPNANFSY